MHVRITAPPVLMLTYHSTKRMESKGRRRGRRTAVLVLLLVHASAARIPEECVVTKVEVERVDYVTANVYYKATLRGPINDCLPPKKIWCDNNSSTLELRTCQPSETKPSNKRIQRNGSICYKSSKEEDCAQLRCGSVVSENFKLPDRRKKQFPEVEFKNGSYLKIHFSKPETINSWQVSVHNSSTKEKIIASEKTSLDVIHISGNYSLGSCYDLKFRVDDKAPPECASGGFTMRDQCYIKKDITSNNEISSTHRLIVVVISVTVCVVMAIVASGMLMYHRHFKRYNDPQDPLLLELKEVLLVYSRESDELTQQVKNLASDILKKTNKKVYDLFDVSPEVLVDPKSWVYGKLHDYQSTTIVLISSYGLLNMLQLLNEGNSDYDVAVVLGREPHACDPLLTTCLSYLHDTCMIHTPERVLITRFKDLEKKEDSQEQETIHLQTSVLYTLPDDQEDFLRALNAPVVQNNQYRIIS